MPTLEELLNLKDQSLASFAPKEDEDLIHENDLSSEEMAAAAALGINTKRLSKKAYQQLKDKAQNIVEQASVPSVTPREAAKGIVKGGGKKSAEASARAFVKAQPSLGFPTKDVAEAVGDAIPSGVVKEAAEEIASKSPFMSRIAQLSARVGGKNVLKSLLSPAAGVALGLLDSEEISSGSEFPYGAGTKKVIADLDSDERTLKDQPRQLASSKFDTVEDIRKDTEKQPVNPLYASLYAEEEKNLANIRSGLENSSDMSNEMKARHYDAALEGYTPEKIQERVSKKLSDIESKSADLKDQINDIDSRLAGEKNPFAIKDLQERKKQYENQLADLRPTEVSSERMLAKMPESDKVPPTSGSDFIDQLPPAPPPRFYPTPTGAPIPEAPAKKTPVGKAIRTSAAGEPTASQVQKEERKEELAPIVGAESAEKIAKQEESERLQNLLKQYNEALAMEGLDRIIAARAGIAPREGYARKILAEKEGLRKGVKEEVKEEEKEDPNSEYSKSMRNLLEEQGIKVPNTISAAFIEKQYPQFVNIMNRREAAKDRAANLRIKLAEIAANRDLNKEEKLSGFIKEARRFATTGDIGKVRTRLIKADQNIDMFDRYSKGSPTGAKDLAGFFGFMKGVQQDDSVIREAEARLGLSLGSLSSRVKARLASFFRGEMFAPEQRQQMLEVLKIQKNQLKDEYTSELKPIYEDLKAQPGMTKKDAKTEFKRITSLDLDFGDDEKESPSSEQKAVIPLPEKSIARLKPGQTFELKSKPGKNYRVNADGKTATEL